MLALSKIYVVRIPRLCPLQLFILPSLNDPSLTFYPPPCLSLKPNAAMVTERWDDEGIRIADFF